MRAPEPLTNGWSIVDYPPLIIEEAVDILRIQNDFSTLKALCLTASVFQETTQRAIFRTAEFKTPRVDSQTFVRTLDQQAKHIETMFKSITARPHLAQYVRVVELNISNEALPTHPSLSHATYLLSGFNRVEKLTLSSGGELLDIEKTELETAIFGILKNPTLTTVDFSAFQSLEPSYLLQLGPSVKNVSLTYGTNLRPFSAIGYLLTSALVSSSKYDILEQYPGKLPKSVARKRLYIERLQLDIRFGMTLSILNQMRQSEYCHLDLSRLTRLVITSNRTIATPFDDDTFLWVIGEICRVCCTTLSHLDFQDYQRGFYFPDGFTLEDFPQLESLTISLKVQEKHITTNMEAMQNLFRFLGNGNVLTKLGQLRIGVEIRPGRLPSELQEEQPVWQELASILTNPAFTHFKTLMIVILMDPRRGPVAADEEGVLRLFQAWGMAFREPLEELDQRGLLDVWIRVMPV